MEVELLVIPGCPGADEAATVLRTALDDIGLAALAFSVGVIETDVEARARGFAASPAFVVDGTDLFMGGQTTGTLACRVYPTPDGPRNVPALHDLRRVLKARAAEATKG
ncbi:hypothetical protein ACFUC1_03145 [Pedococcus sp. NPDC057267]|uniref:hypothetical protein n=1 Tax=Pedococcus sp. NPDC057267 TaxID=3346077 RepID=UPI00363BAAE3